jgi:hypothetical protein
LTTVRDFIGISEIKLVYSTPSSKEYFTHYWDVLSFCKKIGIKLSNIKTIRIDKFEQEEYMMIKHRPKWDYFSSVDIPEPSHLGYNKELHYFPPPYNSFLVSDDKVTCRQLAVPATLLINGYDDMNDPSNEMSDITSIIDLFNKHILRTTLILQIRLIHLDQLDIAKISSGIEDFSSKFESLQEISFNIFDTYKALRTALEIKQIKPVGLEFITIHTKYSFHSMFKINLQYIDNYFYVRTSKSTLSKFSCSYMQLNARSTDIAYCNQGYLVLRDFNS